MRFQRIFAATLAVQFFAIAVGVSVAGEGNEKRKVEERFDVVVWGDTQSLTDNLSRVARQIAAQGGDLGVYIKRFEEVGGHWQKSKEVFAEKGIRWNEDTIYFGHVDWITKERVGLGALSFERPIDHMVRFYVAANRKKGDDDKISERIYAFSGDRYFRANPVTNRVDKGIEEAARIGETGWRGITLREIDAAVVHPRTQIAYFFKNNKYESFDFLKERSRADRNGRRKVATINGTDAGDGWDGVWHDLDAAVFHPKRGAIYFFKGEIYQKFSIEKNRVVKFDDGSWSHKIGVDGWEGVEPNLDAAVLGTSGKTIYFFKNGHCQIFDINKDKVVNLCPNSEVFEGMPTDIDAVLVRPEIE
jgi:hypothetical protein